MTIKFLQINKDLYKLKLDAISNIFLLMLWSLIEINSNAMCLMNYSLCI